ncbi:MAG: hypothetical protein ACMXYL_02020 [Candidatus Woesearchaeota archaeon]
MTKKGQMITEYSSFIGLGLLFAIIIMGFLVSQGARNTEERHRVAVDSQLTRIQNEILSAYISIDGYYSIVEFEPPYLGVRMNLTIEPPIMIIKTEKIESIIYIPQTNGSIFVDQGTISLTKEDGTVQVTSV